MCANIYTDESKLYVWPAAHAHSLKRGEAPRQLGQPLGVSRFPAVMVSMHPSLEHAPPLHPSPSPSMLRLAHSPSEVRLDPGESSDCWLRSSGITWLHFATCWLGGGSLAIMLVKGGIPARLPRDWHPHRKPSCLPWHYWICLESLNAASLRKALIMRVGQLSVH